MHLVERRAVTERGHRDGLGRRLERDGAGRAVRGVRVLRESVRLRELEVVWARRDAVRMR